MPLQLALLVFASVASFAVAAYALLLNRRRREYMSRTRLGLESDRPSRSPLLAKPKSGFRERLPSAWTQNARNQNKMVQAGYESAYAPLAFATVRWVLLVLLPILVWVGGPGRSFSQMVLWTAGAAIVAWVAPIGYLERAIRLRQERLRRSIPDALDLLVVCVEAGISLDAAILRVGREMAVPYPELSRELMIVNRKTNAGVPREEALRELCTRTGVDDIRALVSAMIQSEKWGTSIARVLRVSAETFRQKRRQTAERNAAKAPLKMTIPLITMILPAMFIVILGPAVLSLIIAFSRGR